MQTGYQYCATLTIAVGIVLNRGTGTGVRSFYKFNCALMSTNLRQPDAIREPQRPARRAEERDREASQRETNTLQV